MKIMTNGGVSHIAMTAAERAAGRYMRAPDHDASTGGGQPAPAEGAESATAMPSIEQPAAPPADTTAEDLEKEFGQVDPPATEQPTEEGQEQPPAEGEEPKPKSDVQTRIDELTAGRREAERLAAEARRDAEYWRSQAEAAKPKPTAEQPDPDAAPDPVNYEFGEADAKFIADTARYHARQEFAVAQQEATLRADLATMESNWQTNSGKVAEKYPDFNDKVVAGADRQDWDCSPLMAIGIKSSEFGPDIAYHLATNPAESKRIAKMTNIEQAREFGRLEARFEFENKAAAQPQPKPTSSAPPPPTGQVRGAGGRFAVNADTDDFSAFEKSADAMLRK